MKRENNAMPPTLRADIIFSNPLQLFVYFVCTTLLKIQVKEEKNDIRCTKPAAQEKKRYIDCVERDINTAMAHRIVLKLK